MRILMLAILLCSLSLLAATEFTVSTVKELYKAVNSNNSDITITLKPGIYNLTPKPVVDSTLGNALNPDSMIIVTTGLHLVGKNIKLIGLDRNKVIIKTHAGYGIFIEYCPKVLIKDLTITDGVRDQDGNATSGAIVVKNSNTEITGCIIADNQGDFSKTIAGIIGICGREGSDLYIHNNIISDNSWDGIALYRGAQAGYKRYFNIVGGIRDNLIYNGRGAGIGITWDAEAFIKNNVIHHYWKGIGTFGTSRANVEYNLVRDVRGWGIIVSGNSHMDCFYNEVRRAGNVGVAVWDSTATMHFIVGNVICQSGQEKQWIAPLVGIWINGPDSLDIYQNLFWGNREADLAFGYKEPGPDGSSFTFSHAEQRFNNNWINPPTSLDTLNYYTPKPLQDLVIKASTSSIIYPESALLEQLASDLFHGGRGIYSEGDWSWDPDGDPFLK